MFVAEGMTPYLAAFLLGLGIVLLGLVGWLDHRTEGRPRAGAEWPSSSEERRLMRGNSEMSLLMIDHTGPIRKKEVLRSERASAPRTKTAAAAPTTKPAATTTANTATSPSSTPTRAEPAAPRAKQAARPDPPKPARPKAVPLSAVAPATPARSPAPSVTVIATESAAPTPRASAARPAAPALVDPPATSPAPDAISASPSDEPRPTMPKGASEALDALFGDVLGDRVA